MNNETEKQLASLIEAAKQTGSDVSSFIQQQAPELADQLVRWKIFGGASEFILGSVVLLVCAALLYAAKRNFYDKGRDEALMGLSVVAVGFFVLMGVAFAYSGAAQVVKAVVAPKVMVAESIAELINPKK